MPSNAALQCQQRASPKISLYMACNACKMQRPGWCRLCLQCTAQSFLPCSPLQEGACCRERHTPWLICMSVLPSFPETKGWGNVGKNKAVGVLPTCLLLPKLLFKGKKKASGPGGPGRQNGFLPLSHPSAHRQEVPCHAWGMKAWHRKSLQAETWDNTEPGGEGAAIGCQEEGELGSAAQFNEGHWSHNELSRIKYKVLWVMAQLACMGVLNKSLSCPSCST